MTKSSYLLTLGILTTALAQPARSEVIFYLHEVGNDVVLEAYGTLNTAGVTLNADSGSPFIRQTTTGFNLTAGAGGFNTAVQSFILQSGQLLIGNGTSFNPTVSAGSGPFLGIAASANVVLKLPSNYVSGTYLSSSLTAANTRLSDFAFYQGTHVFKFGSGINQDQVTLQIGTPEPASIALGGFGILALIGLHWRRRSRRT